MNETDAISRQMAIDTIMGQPPEPHYPSWYAAQIEELPAVQPATNCSEIPNGSDDTISRRAAIDALDCINGVEEVLRSLPSAQPEIIRCKDCKNYLHDEEYGFDWCNRMSGVFRAKPDGFCSWAVMRGGGTE